MSILKMATGTYPMSTGHPYPHPPDQNLTRRVTRTRRRVENSFHTRTRRVILTRQYTRVHTPKYNSFQQNKSIIEQQNRNMGWWSGVRMRIRVWGSSRIYILICLYGPNMGYMLIWTKIAEVGYYLCRFFLPAGMGSIHPHPYPHTRWVQEFIQ